MTEEEAKKKIAEVAEWLRNGAPGNSVEHQLGEYRYPTCTLANSFYSELLDAALEFEDAKIHEIDPQHPPITFQVDEII